MTKAADMIASQEQLAKLQKDCGIPSLPTQLTYWLRLGVSGIGPRAYDWSDKPHRLLYDACGEVERQSTLIAHQERRIEALREKLDQAADNLEAGMRLYDCPGLSAAASIARMALENDHD